MTETYNNVMKIPLEIIVALFAAFITLISGIISFVFYVVFMAIKSVRDESKEDDHRINARVDKTEEAQEQFKNKAIDNDKALFIKTEEMRVKDAYERGKRDAKQ